MMDLISQFLPEILVVAVALALLLYGVFRGPSAFISTGVLAAVSLLGLVAWLAFCGGAVPVLSFFERYIKVLLLGLTSFAILVASRSFVRETERKPEVPVLLLLAVAGGMVMVSCRDLIGLYVGIELQNLALYVLVALYRDRARSSEAALKYFSLGAFSSALLLFGASYLYGLTGSVAFAQIAAFAPQGMGYGIGVAFVLAGLAFKISAVPFHLWTPDVYEGAPAPVTAFLASTAKVAALAVVAAVCLRVMPLAASLWQPILMVLSVASIAWGALGGLGQTSFKRLMAYSAMVNVGTMLIGLVLLPAQGATAVAGLQGVLVYLPLYAFGTLGGLAGLAMLSPVAAGDRDDLSILAGLGHTQPRMALALAVCLFSLAGVPPLAGFFGKYLVLLAAVQGGLVWLAVFGVLGSVIAAAYYLKVVKIMYFDPSKGLPVALISGRIPSLCVYLIALGLVVMILFPTPLIEGARLAAESLLSK